MCVGFSFRQLPGQSENLGRAILTGALLLVLFVTSVARAQEAWSPVAGPTPQNLWGVAWGAGKFVVVGEAGTIITSPDGITWTARTSGTTNWLTNVGFLNGAFIAVGDRGTILVSSDGIQWSSRSLNTPRRFNAVSYGNGAYLIVTEGTGTEMSADTVNWTGGASLFRARGLTFAYGNFIVTGERGLIATGANSATMRTQGLGTNAFIESVAFGRRTFVAVGVQRTADSRGQRRHPAARKRASLPRGPIFCHGRRCV